MKREIRPFEHKHFGQLRRGEKDGKHCVNLNDTMKMYGFSSNSRRMILGWLDRDDYCYLPAMCLVSGVPGTSKARKTQNEVFIFVDGFKKIAERSDKPLAREMRDWALREVFSMHLQAYEYGNLISGVNLKEIVTHAVREAVDQVSLIMQEREKLKKGMEAIMPKNSPEEVMDRGYEQGFLRRSCWYGRRKSHRSARMEKSIGNLFLALDVLQEGRDVMAKQLEYLVEDVEESIAEDECGG